MNHIEAAIEKAGGAAGLAEKLGVSIQSVYSWRSGKRGLPHQHGARIESLTGGAVTRKDLWPDSWQRIWPELASTPTQEAVAQVALAQAIDKAVDSFGASRLAAALASEQKPAAALDGHAVGAIAGGVA